jgi:hypothetical protein
MNRREFLSTTVATVAATAATGPMILGAEDKAGAKAKRMGSGAHVFEVTHGWGTLPKDMDWQTTHNIAVDSAGHVYITHQGIGKVMDTVLVFDDKGKFVHSFGKEWHGGGHGVDVRKEGSEEFLYVTNTWKSPKVVKTTLKSEIVWKLERPETPAYADPKVTYNPTNVAFAPDGSFFVGDGYGQGSQILKYGMDGKLLKSFGKSGTGEGQFRTPHGNWVDNRDPKKPTLVVCDRANARLQTFTLDGEFLSMTKKGDILFPANADTQGKLMLISDLHARLTIIDEKGEFTHLGYEPEWTARVLKENLRSKPKEWVDGKFIHPHDACFDASGNILVAEWVDGGRVAMLKKV